MGKQNKTAFAAAAKNNIKKIQKAILKRQDLQRAILQAAEKAGEKFGRAGLVSYLEAQALAMPSPFLALLGKVLTEGEEKTLPPICLIDLVPSSYTTVPAREEKTETANDNRKPAGQS